MVKHNNVIPGEHFRKNWQNYVKAWFNQPVRKTRRREARQEKVVKIFPWPTSGPLQPVVRGSTNLEIQYEKAAGIPRNLAPTIGISVDHRRKNRSLEEFQANVPRLKILKNNLLVFPRRARKFKAGDSSAEELGNATQVQGELPIIRDAPTVNLLKVTNYMTAFKAYEKICFERMNERQVGERMKKAVEAEREEK